ncbi:hypothetical protein DLAC_11532 [Tieghemostelium lacteum]|uniref:Cytochrome b5 heme-binding domain-containing protein n=1 Tax=Tieghemostelium lacteum TaxID=361077 RepID=A0A152A3R0_TIELA|nr:hypothetical protein DLAC_11532 [Tieghemostelium lacteum]|eukprot:KYR00844.1 hypothetical protein DLAC_11532 [Tieghemostelium lacteum]
MVRISSLLRYSNNISKIYLNIQKPINTLNICKSISSKSLLTNNSNSKCNILYSKRFYASDIDEAPWMLEKVDPTDLKFDHPGFPNSTLFDTTLPVFTLKEVSRHNNKDDCWIIINEKVYNVTSYVSSHPGGDAILSNAGGDSTSAFFNSPMTVNAHLVMKDFHIGYCHNERRFDGFTPSNRPDEHH